MFDEYRNEAHKLEAILSKAGSLESYAVAVAALRIVLKEKYESLSELEKDRMLKQILYLSTELSDKLEKEHESFMTYVKQEAKALRSYL